MKTGIFYKELIKADLMATFSGFLNFDTTFKKRKEVELEKVKYIFIGYDELIESKLRSGRSKDLDDVKNLKEIHRH